MSNITKVVAYYEGHMFGGKERLTEDIYRIYDEKEEDTIVYRKLTWISHLLERFRHEGILTSPYEFRVLEENLKNFFLIFEQMFLNRTHRSTVMFIESFLDMRIALEKADSSKTKVR